MMFFSSESFIDRAAAVAGDTDRNFFVQARFWTCADGDLLSHLVLAKFLAVGNEPCSVVF